LDFVTIVFLKVIQVSKPIRASLTPRCCFWRPGL